VFFVEGEGPLMGRDFHLFGLDINVLIRLDLGRVHLKKLLPRRSLNAQVFLYQGFIYDNAVPFPSA
jgi:hypothetical protein